MSVRTGWCRQVRSIFRLQSDPVTQDESVHARAPSAHQRSSWSPGGGHDSCWLTHEQLGGAVPQRDHVVGVGAQRGPVLARQAEVADLELAAVAVQDVAGLQVAVQHPVLVQVVHPAEQLQHQALHLRQQQARLSAMPSYLFCTTTPCRARALLVGCVAARQPPVRWSKRLACCCEGAATQQGSCSRTIADGARALSDQ